MTLDALGPFLIKHGEQTPAGRAWLRQGAAPGGKLAVGIVDTAVEDASALACAFLHQVPAALGTGRARLDQQRRGVAAIGELAASDELAEAPPFDHQRAPTLGTHLSGRFIADLDLLHILSSPLQGLRERLIELAQDRHPLLLARRNAIEILLHMGGETDIYDVGEVLYQ